jgi:hypothetical protein
MKERHYLGTEPFGLPLIVIQILYPILTPGQVG